ncbi:MAG TPA: alkaline phosphatase family protein [Actinotalea sp.]
MWIWFENKPDTAVLGSPASPYLDALVGGCAVAADYHGITHPSLPNYLAATSGSTQGVSDDAAPDRHQLAGPSLFSQVSDSGREWRSYQEAMPGTCALLPEGRYAVKHNPAAYFTAIRDRCAQWDVPLDRLTADLGAGGALPAFALIVPDLCNDTHDCPVETGDAWLSALLPTLLDSAAYRSGTTAVMITWDEDDSRHDNRVPLVVLAPSITPGTRLAGRLDHYSLLASTEDLLGLPRLGAAVGAAVLPAP